MKKPNPERPGGVRKLNKNSCSDIYTKVSRSQRPGEEHRHKEILSFQLTDVEDIASWKGFLADLKGRGLLGKKLKLIITNGNPALLKAIKTIYPFTKGQHCIAHKMRNVAVKIKKMNRPHCLKEAKLIFASNT